MAELIDLLFVFWILVAGAVCIVGTIYETHLREKRKALARRQRRLESVSRVDDWRPNSSTNFNETPTVATTSQQNSSHHQYNYSTAADSSNQNQPTNSTYSYTSPYDSSAHANKLFKESNNSAGTIRQTDFGHYDAEPSKGSLTYALGGQLAGTEREAGLGQRFWAGNQPATDQSIPTATGYNSDCVDWVNRILFLFYSQANKYGPIIGENIYRSLNEKLANILSSSMEFSDWTIEFQSIDLQSSTKPELKNVRTESESDKSVSAVCKVYNQRLVCNLKLQRARLSMVRAGLRGDSDSDESGAINYELTLENLEGKLKSVGMFEEKLLVVQFMEKPDTKILLKQLNRYARSPMNEDTLVSLILQALTQVVVDMYFGDDPDFPQFIKQTVQQHHQSMGGYRNKLSQLKVGANEIKRQIKHDFLGALSLADNKERKLFVKLLRAKNINYNQNVTCILELSQPRQLAISSTKQGSNPFWDEHFLFLANERASNNNNNNSIDKLTVELWDSLDPALIKAAKQQQQNDSGRQKSNRSSSGGQQKGLGLFNKGELTVSGKFLGLVRLSMDELRRNPVQKQTLRLESGVSQDQQAHQTASNLIGGLDLSDSIGGELHLELMFLEHSSSSSSNLRKSASANSISSLGLGADQGDVVSVDRKLTQSGYLITTTTIAKPAGGQQKRASSRDRLSPVARNHSPISSATEQSGAALMDLSSLDGLSSQPSGDQTSQQMAGGDGDDEGTGDRADSRQSRSRSRSRGFLRAIKRRFSFSSRSRRSRSVSESASPSFSRAESQSTTATLGRQRANNLDTISIDSRSRASSEVSVSGRAKSMPASRDSNEVPTIVINKSRLSDASSAFIFAQPKSQLVIECREQKMSDGSGSSKDRTLLRHYAIPDDPASERRWRRRGVKLHVFNEHQFVACHLAGSSTCHLCGRVFSRRPGKQGYKCRNCHLLSHKQCHVKVDHNCPYASKDGLKLEYIDADPPASLVFEKTHSASSSAQQQEHKPSRPTPRLAMKSISVEVDDR